MLQEKNRKYYSNIKYHKKIYLVYYKKNSAGGYDKLVSDGPFKKLEEAQDIMIKNLSEGICSWIVSYEG
tara:strand:+ start:115 stop:321 length:207 start_codon:yes stop_codon:yes gene_type:complete